jgi:xylose isomerase
MMLVFLDSGGFKTGGINFDAKIRRNSTDLEDLFIAHISGMDAFARALIISDNIIKDSPYIHMKKDRYSSFDSGNGALFASGKLSLEALAEIGKSNGEPTLKSGKQELYEQLINMYI